MVLSLMELMPFAFALASGLDLALGAAAVQGAAALSCRNKHSLPKEQAPALKCLHLGECQKSHSLPLVHSPFK